MGEGQKACSQFVDCHWSVIMDNGKNGRKRGPEEIERFVIRELEAGKKVLINGGVAPNPAWAVYAEIAKKYADSGQVWYVDTQTNPLFDVSDPDWFAGDGKHPSAKVAEEIFVPAIAKVIQMNT